MKTTTNLVVLALAVPVDAAAMAGFATRIFATVWSLRILTSATAVDFYTGTSEIWVYRPLSNPDVLPMADWTDPKPLRRGVCSVAHH